MPEIRYTFSETGADGVAGAFRSISAAADASGASVRAAGSSTAAASRQSGGAARSAARAHKDEFAALTSKVSSQKRFAQQVEAANRKRIAGIRAVAREEERAAKKAQRAVEKAEREKTRAVEKAARKREQVWNRRGRRAGQLATGGLRMLGGAALAAGTLLGAAVGAGVRRDIRLQDRAQALAVRGTGLTGTNADGSLHMNRVQSGASLSRDFRSLALRTPGSKAADIERGASKFVEKTGDLGLAKKFAPVMARIALATGTDQGDLGDIAADFVKKFGIKSAGEVDVAMSTLAVQGKRGQFEMSDAAKQFPKIAAAASRFGIQKGAAGVGQLGGLTQIARDATRSGSEAGTAVENFFRELTVKSKMIKKKTGVNVFTDKGKTKGRDFTQLIPEIIGGAKGNIDVLQKIFGARGIRAVSKLVSIFNEAAGPSKDYAKAQRAVSDALTDSIVVQDAVVESQRDAAIMAETNASKMAAAGEAWDALVAQNVTPAVNELISRFLSLSSETDVFDKILSSAGDVVTAFVMVAEVAERLNLIDKSPGKVLERKKGQRERAQGELAALRAGRANAISILGSGVDVDKTPKGALVADAIRKKQAEIVKLDSEIRPLEAADDVASAKRNAPLGKVGVMQRLKQLRDRGDVARPDSLTGSLITGALGPLSGPLVAEGSSVASAKDIDAKAVQTILASRGTFGNSASDFTGLNLSPERIEALSRFAETVNSVANKKGELTPDEQDLRGEIDAASPVQIRLDSLQVDSLQGKINALSLPALVGSVHTGL